MPDMREGGLGTAACYLTVERLALQAGVESPFWDETSLLMGGCDEPWYKKPLTPRRLRSFLKRYGGSLPDDDGQRGHAASVFADVMRLHGIPMEDGADDLGALYVRRAESVGMTVAFLATGCTLADMAAITGFCEETDMKIPASKVPAQVWADKARRRGDLDEVESMLLSSWDDSKQVYRIGKELWDELRIDEADEVPVDALLRLPYGCIFIERRWVDEYEQLLTKNLADVWGEASCYVTRYYEGCFCWIEGRTLFVGSLTHHCEMRHTDDYGAVTAEARRGMRMFLETIALPIDEGISLARWYSEHREAVLEANESISYAQEVTDEEILMTARADSYLLEHILGSLLYISSKEADVRTVYVPQKNQTRKSRQTDCTVHDVGFRIAPQLAEVRRVYEHERQDGETGRHVAPHVRRGHWHGYWTGPRENPTGLEIKWIAPTVVNASRGELEGTVHEVGGRDA